MRGKNKFISANDLCHKSGVTSSTVSCYEKMGMIYSVKQTGGVKSYPIEALRTVKIIEKAKLTSGRDSGKKGSRPLIKME